VTSKRNRNKIKARLFRISSAATDSYDAGVLIPSGAAGGEDGDSYLLLPLPTSACMDDKVGVGHSPVQPAAAMRLLPLAIMRSIRDDHLPLLYFLPRYVASMVVRS
jgi:hypothetical protein